MSKSNKYKIYYNLVPRSKFNTIYTWKISIEKLNLTIFYNSENNKHFIIDNFNISNISVILNNFLIEPVIITMLKGKDDLNTNLAFEILNQRLNERTKPDTKRSRKSLV